MGPRRRRPPHTGILCDPSTYLQFMFGRRLSGQVNNKTYEPFTAVSDWACGLWACGLVGLWACGLVGL